MDMWSSVGVEFTGDPVVLDRDGLVLKFLEDLFLR